MTIFSYIRNKLASALFVAPVTTVKQQQADTLLDNQHAAKLLATSYKQEAPVVGHISSDDITILNSVQSQQAIVDQGLFMAISKAFNGVERDDETRTAQACEEFRAWNNCLNDGKQRMSAKNVAIRVRAFAKAPPKNVLTPELAAELAEVTGIPAAKQIADEKAANEALAAKREAAMQQVYSDLTSILEATSAATMKASVAIGAIRRKAAWVGRWNNAKAKIAEIRDMKTDIDLLKSMARHEEQDSGLDFEEGTMRADALFHIEAELSLAHKAGESAEGHAGYEPDALAEAYKERDQAALEAQLQVVRRRRVIKQAA